MEQKYFSLPVLQMIHRSKSISNYVPIKAKDRSYQCQKAIRENPLDFVNSDELLIEGNCPKGYFNYNLVSQKEKLISNPEEHPSVREKVIVSEKVIKNRKYITN